VSTTATATVRYNLFPGQADLNFTNVIEIRRPDGKPFAEQGDSGAAVVTEDGKTCIGIVFSVSTHDYSENSPAVTYVLPIQTVLAELKVTLL
jgi:hypothetical protein